MLRKFVSLLTAILMTFSLCACSTDESVEETSSRSDEINAIVVYYSATGNTEKVAQTISDHFDIPIYELEPVDPYSEEDLNYSDEQSRVSIEHEEHINGDLEVELTTTDFDEFSDADYIFLGAPVWWQELSWVVEDFVKENDFSDKTIIPFATSASSDFNLDNLTPLATNADWGEARRFSSNVDEDEVIEWLNELNLS